MRHTKRGRGALALPRPMSSTGCRPPAPKNLGSATSSFAARQRTSKRTSLGEGRQKQARLPLDHRTSHHRSWAAAPAWVVESPLSLRFLQHRAEPQLFARLVVRPARPPRAVLQLLSRLLPRPAFVLLPRLPPPAQRQRAREGA